MNSGRSYLITAVQIGKSYMTWWWWIDFSLIKVIGLFVWPTHHTTLYCYVVSRQVSSLVRDVATLFYSDSRKRERCLNKEIFETEI